MFNCNGTPSEVLTFGKRVGKPNHELVEQAERLALANFQTPLDIPTLCRAQSFSEEPGPIALSTSKNVEIIGSKAGAVVGPRSLRDRH
jgi:hypothetical protein